MIPFVDLQPEYEICREAIDGNIRHVLQKQQFIGGEMVDAFEREMAAYQNCEEIVSCGNGTDALFITLRALGIGSGDEVITSPCTAMPTAEAITLAGGRVVFADIQPGTYSLDPQRAAEAVTLRTRAIICVHLYGIPCDLDGMRQVAKDHGIYLVEDCAQAQGARWHGQRVGNLGDAACFSFFPSKPLGAFGDAGAMTAKDAAVRRRQRMFANHGRLTKFSHEIEGTNSRLDAIQAAVLRPKLALLDSRNALRQQAAAWYYEELDGVKGVIMPCIPHGAEAVWHIFPIRVHDRDGLQRHLKASGIESGLHYPLPLHMQPAYAYLRKGAGSFPEAERAFSEELSLPMFPAISREQVKEVCRAVRDFVSF
mgnify:CR=1 FL=1